MQQYNEQEIAEFNDKARKARELLEAPFFVEIMEYIKEQGKQRIVDTSPSDAPTREHYYTLYRGATLVEAELTQIIEKPEDIKAQQESMANLDNINP